MSARKRQAPLAAVALLLAATAAAPAHAQPDGAPGTHAPTEAQQKAEQHYKRARELYGAGSYHEAAAELEAAHALDPNAKELVFNLGVVNEKLGRIDDALRYFRAYSQMEGVTAAEHQKADAFIRRLEGAKREIPPPAPTGTAPATPGARRGTGGEAEHPVEKGRIDGATIAVASIAVVGLAAGMVFGVKALADKPKANYHTGSGPGADGTYSDLQSASKRASTEALIADVGFGVGIVAAAVTAYLYFARPKVQSSPALRMEPTAPAPRAQLSFSPRIGGGALVVQGSF